MTVYIAAPYARKADAKEARRQFEAAGLSVHARWIDFDPGRTITTTILQEEAIHDVEDIIQADVLVVLNLQLSEGKAWEQGFAYGLGMPIIAVGQPQHCVFHHLDVYRWVPDVAAAIAAVKSI